MDGDLSDLCWGFIIKYRKTLTKVKDDCRNDPHEATRLTAIIPIPCTAVGWGGDKFFVSKESSVQGAVLGARGMHATLLCAVRSQCTQYVNTPLFSSLYRDPKWGCVALIGCFLLWHPTRTHMGSFTVGYCHYLLQYFYSAHLVLNPIDRYVPPQ